MMVRHRPQPARLRQAAAGMVLLGSFGVWLGGCAMRAQADASVGPSGAGTAAPAGPPPGAIRVGRDLYQVPIGADADGCQMYRLYSPTLLVTEAISYRSRAGGFTVDKRAAVCDPAPSAGGFAAPRADDGRKSDSGAPIRRSPALASRM